MFSGEFGSLVSPDSTQKKHTRLVLNTEQRSLLCNWSVSDFNFS